MIWHNYYLKWFRWNPLHSKPVFHVGHCANCFLSTIFLVDSDMCLEWCSSSNRRFSCILGVVSHTVHCWCNSKEASHMLQNPESLERHTVTFPESGHMQDSGKGAVAAQVMRAFHWKAALVCCSISNAQFADRSRCQADCPVCNINGQVLPSLQQQLFQVDAHFSNVSLLPWMSSKPEKLSWLFQWKSWGNTD